MASEDQLGALLLERQWRTYAPEWDESTPEQLTDAFELFCREQWSIRHPSRGRILFQLTESQRETAEIWVADRRSIALKARQIGFSTLASAFVFWLAFFYPDRQIVLLSRTEREAVELLRKSKYGYSQLPEWMKARGPVLQDRTRLKMTFSNESEIESMPSGSDPARGKSVFLVIVDEMAFLPNSDEAWASIEPISEVGGRVILLSTANGVGNIFYEIWQGSQNGAGVGKSFTGIFHAWSAGMDRSQEWYDAKKEELPDWQLAQEYPDNPEEAFLRSGRPIFDLDALRALTPIKPARGHLRDTEDGLEFLEDGGPLRVWQRPEPKHLYVIGADVSEGLKHGDYSSAHVIDARTKQVVAHWHGLADLDQYGDILFQLGQWYGKALLGVEMNGPGLVPLKRLQEVKYPNLFRARTETHRMAQQTEKMGWLTNQNTKPMAVHELNGAIRDGGIHLFCEETQAELLTYVREDSGKMNGSPHDDRVMSLAIANQMLKWAFAPEFTVSDKPGPGTFGWLEEKLTPKRFKKFTIGQDAVRS